MATLWKVPRYIKTSAGGAAHLSLNTRLTQHTMGTKFRVRGVVWLLLVVNVVAEDTSQSVERLKGTSSEQTRIVNLKHRRYKSLRDNVTSVHERIALPTSNIESASVPVIHEHIHFDELPHPHVKTPRNGFAIQKSPPDLQFGLSFTVPFVSLSTEKLLGIGSGKSYGDTPGSSLLKLNFSGLLLAAVVGLVAAAGIFLPSILNTGLSPHGLLDSILPPHFTENQYNDYGNGWGDKGWKSEYNKEWSGRRNGRAENTITTIGATFLKLMDKFKSGVSTVEKCVVQRVCEEKKNNKEGRISKIVEGLGENDVVKDVGVYKALRKVVGGDLSVCGKVEGVEGCKEIGSFEDGVAEILEGWRKGGEEGEEKSGSV